MLTTAPGSTPPDSSFTVPAIAPVSTWAFARADSSNVPRTPTDGPCRSRLHQRASIPFLSIIRALASACHRLQTRISAFRGSQTSLTVDILQVITSGLQGRTLAPPARVPMVASIFPTLAAPPPIGGKLRSPGGNPSDRARGHGVAAAGHDAPDGGVHGRLVAAAAGAGPTDCRKKKTRAPRLSSSPSAAASATRTRWRRKDGSTSRTWPSELVPQGLVYPVGTTRGADRTLQLHRRAGHRLPPERRCLRGRGAGLPRRFQFFRKEHRLQPEEAWVIATNKSFGLMGGSKLRAFGDLYSANVVLPKQLLIKTIKSAVSTDAGPGVENRQALAERMMLALDEGTRDSAGGCSVRPRPRPRVQGEPRKIAARLLQRPDGRRAATS